ncbi:hypothetical protein CKAH01_06124 [Colletotrichum kahawae]|uniref:Uncharacterized protein n=1 Tax=Colletotrichum kahawae TaxID=34407 RepID=A0AAD9YBI9_COLKA|nr:hypothetical protein CKAH01_06124 [Colletotrichum kahawae]
MTGRSRVLRGVDCILVLCLRDGPFSTLTTAWTDGKRHETIPGIWEDIIHASTCLSLLATEKSALHIRSVVDVRRQFVTT